MADLFKDSFGAQNSISFDFQKGDIILVNVCLIYVTTKILLTGDKTFITTHNKFKMRPIAVTYVDGSKLKFIAFSTDMNANRFKKVRFDFSHCTGLSKCMGLIKFEKNAYIFCKMLKGKGKFNRVESEFGLMIQEILGIAKNTKLFKKALDKCGLSGNFNDFFIKCGKCDLAYLDYILKMLV